MNKIKFLTLSILALFSMQTATAEVLTFNSNYTPVREGVKFQENIQGFSYPTFNNFTSNPNIATGGRQGDERAFTTAKFCKSGTCDNAVVHPDNKDAYFYDTLASSNLKEGDVIRFEVYFHNNGNDSYNEFTNETSPDATNVKIGVDLEDISAAPYEPELMIRPKGFIYSDNNEYRTNQSDSNTVIKDSNGNILRMATDDIQAFLDSTDLYLEPTDSMAIAMRKVNKDLKDWDIKTDKADDYWEWALFGFLNKPASTTFKIPNTTNEVTVNVTPVVSGKKMYLLFDKLPGCFRYSGAAYFDVKVVKKIKPTPKPEPLFCKAATFSALDFDTKETVDKLNEGNYLLNINYFQDSNKNKQIAASNTKTLWESTDQNGEFYELSQFAMSKISRNSGAKSPYTGSNQVIYTGGGQISAKLIELEGKSTTDNVCFAKIEQAPNKCATLTLTTSVADPKVGDNLDLVLSGKDIFGKNLPLETKIDYKTTTDGVFEGATSTGSLIQTTLGEKVNLTQTKLAGTISATINSSDPMASDLCLGSLNIKEQPTPEEPAKCESLDVTLKDYGTSNNVDVLKPNQIYEITAKANYDKALNSNVNLEIDEQYGRFIAIPSYNSVISPFTLMLNGLQLIDTLTKETLEEYYGPILTNAKYQDLKPEETIVLVVFSTADIDKENILKVYESTLGDEVCTKYFSFEKPIVITTCESLKITLPQTPWKTTDYLSEAFEIEVQTTPQERVSDLFYHWNIINGNGTWDTESQQGKLTNTLQNFDDEVEVGVWASLNEDGTKSEALCKDELAIVPEDIKPEITKFVYPKNDWADADKLINISDTIAYVTYAIGVETGTAKTLKVKEEAFKNGKIYGDKNGTLQYKDLRINITEQDGRKYTLLKSSTYKDDKEDAQFETYGNKTLQNFESYFRCETTENKKFACIDGSFDKAIQNLKEGKDIEFGNIQKNSVIRIKIQAENNTNINAKSCEKIDVSNGCGEQFNNTASFTSTKYSGNDSSEVIVVCPYVLSRQGGDTFFHDVLDTGIDVAKCAPVKSSTGPVITPTPKVPRGLIKTGEGDEKPKVSLTLPTHDICKYSNSDSNLENYNDVLKNFSSTICELRVEVAEEWKLTNIVTKIQANVERISRWGNNLTISSVSSQNDLTNLKNNTSGVFVKENGDLTIGKNSAFIVEQTGSIPAAQTFIIKNGDLHIKNNVQYGRTDFSRQKSIPSVAFIVLDGNIIIDDNVTMLDGVYMAVDLDPKDKDATGKITNGSNATTEKLLRINGNLIGDVNELFASRVGIGNPKKDEGSITITQDQRLLFNTPPGLNELIDINQSLVP